MKVRQSPLFNLCTGRNIVIDSRMINELNTLVSEFESHPFKNMVSIIYYNLKKGERLRMLPKSLSRKLKERYYEALASDINKRTWLERFISRDLPEDIQIILLKGSASWGTIYPPDAPRMSCDIDLLVRERDFDKIVKIIERQGRKNVLDEKRVFSNFTIFKYTYSIENLPVSLEIHKRLSYPFVGNVDYDLLFERSIPHPYYKDKRVRVLIPVDRIINILIHSINHAGTNVHELIDSYLILRKYRLKPESVIETARSYKLSDYAILYLNFLYKLMENRENKAYSILSSGMLIKKEIFNFVFNSEYRLNMKVRQLLSLFLIDDFTDCIRFLRFYSGIRIKDILYYYLPLLSKTKI